MNSIILNPISSEKVTTATEKNNVYCFKVDKRANKVEIKKTVQKIFNVHVTAVRTMLVAKKKKSRMTKKKAIEGFKPSYKKAYVEVKFGESIDLFNIT